MSIDLARVRALVERAQQPTTDGLDAREALVPLAAAMADELEAFGSPYTEWGVRCRAWRDPARVDLRDDEQDAREFIALMPAGAWTLVRRQRWHRAGEWVEVPVDAQTPTG